MIFLHSHSSEGHRKQAQGELDLPCQSLVFCKILCFALKSIQRSLYVINKVVFSNSQSKVAQKSLFIIARKAFGSAVVCGVCIQCLHRLLLCLELLWNISGALVFELKSFLLNSFLK